MENFEGMNPLGSATEEGTATKTAEVCANCGATLEEGQELCPKCGTPKKKKNVCAKCGAELQEGQEFCPKCGQKVGLAVDSNVSSAINQFNAGVTKKNNKKKAIPIVVAALAIIAIIAFVILKGPAVESVSLTKSSLEMKVGDSQSVTYTIAPEKASKAKVKWDSSNESVATVNSDGKITAKGEGSCTITVTAGKKTATVSVVVKDTINFMTQYGKYKDEDWCEIASDGSWMILDTNPSDADSDDIWDYYDAYVAVSDLIPTIHKDLGFKSSVEQKMNETTAMQGRQSESNDDYEVSWTYHPDKGLEIMYEVK